VPADRSTSRAFELLNRYSLPLILLGLLALFSVWLPDTFFTADNFKTIANEQTVVLLLALAVVAPLIVGEFDLSIGYVLGLSQALVIGFMAKSGLGAELSIPLVLIICGLVGLLNGLLVVRLQIHALIVTLATGSILTGVVFGYTDGEVLFEGVPAGFTTLAREQLLGIPLPVFYLAAVVIAFELLLTRTVTGRRLYATGGNRNAARLSGIATNRLVLGSFVASGVLAGLGGILIAARLGSAQPGLGANLILPAFAAAFLGATTIRPGRFNVLGTVVAVYVLAVPIAGLQQLGVASWFEYVFNGLALVIAVGTSNQMGLIRERRARKDRVRALKAGRGAPAAAEPVPD
jgi:ribose transport system permease protein